MAYNGNDRAIVGTDDVDVYKLNQVTLALLIILEAGASL